MKINLNLISNFNIELLKRNIESKNSVFINKVRTSPYGQLYQSIYYLEENLDTINFIWSLPEKHIKNFQNALNFKKISKKALMEEVDEYAELIISISKKSKFIITPTWQNLSYYRSMGIMDWKHDYSIKFLLSEMNTKLAYRFKSNSNIFLLDSSNWQLSNEEYYDPKMWYLTKVPFKNSIFEIAAENIINTIRTLITESKKLIVVDLDNTIWGGLIGELTFEKINIGGHNLIGEAYKDFQMSLLALHKRGILLGVVSKNDEEIAIKAFEKNPEMILKKEHFATIKINWNDKANNLVEIAEELNIGLDSIVFFDDNPVEREQIKTLLPEVYVPNLPSDPSVYSILLNKMRCFDQVVFTKDDQKRNQSYLDNKLRLKLKEKLVDKDDWLKKLDTKIEIEQLNSLNAKRVSQLFNKTNQFNLSTRRLTEEQIKSFYEKKENELITISVTDKFGDLGLVGLIGINLNKENVLKVVDLILSCRAMGRGIEETMLYLINNKVKKFVAKNFSIKYIKTDKNNPILIFLKKANLEEKEINIFNSKSQINYSKPSSVKIIYK